MFVGTAPIHTHVYSNGHICLDVLYDKWTPALGVGSLCLSVHSMLAGPAPPPPLSHPPPRSAHRRAAGGAAGADGEHFFNSGTFDEQALDRRHAAAQMVRRPHLHQHVPVAGGENIRRCALPAAAAVGPAVAAVRVRVDEGRVEEVQRRAQQRSLHLLAAPAAVAFAQSRNSSE